MTIRLVRQLQHWRLSISLRQAFRLFRRELVNGGQAVRSNGGERLRH